MNDFSARGGNNSDAPVGWRLEEQIYGDLLARIQSGKIALGERLPTENDLASTYSVSRPVVRAALARLREVGLIVSRRGAGSFVSAGDPGQAAGGYPSLSSIDDIAQFFQFRKNMECETAALAARSPVPALISEMRKALDEMDLDIEAGRATVEQDVIFHRLIADMSGNRFMQESLKMLRPHNFFVGQFVRSLNSTSYISGKMNMRSEHIVIIDAIERGDPDDARWRMAKHIEASEQRIFKGE